MRDTDCLPNQIAAQPEPSVLCVSETIRLDAPLARVFECAVAAIESGHPPPEGETGASLTRVAMGQGFRLAWRSRVAGGSAIELEVRTFVEYEGWTAVSTTTPRTSWAWHFSRARDRTAVTQEICCEVERAGLLRNSVTKRRMRQPLSRAFEQLRGILHRAEALDRLRRREWRPAAARSPPARINGENDEDEPPTRDRKKSS